MEKTVRELVKDKNNIVDKITTFLFGVNLIMFTIVWLFASPFIVISICLILVIPIGIGLCIASFKEPL